MYLFKNAITSITRNKGRNVLIGIIIVVIAFASTITLAIKNTASNIIKEYQNANDIIGTISFNRESIMKDFKGGQDGIKENIEKFNEVEQITIDQINEYGDSKYLKGYYYMYATSLDSDTLTKATDTYEYEVEDRESSTNTTTSSFGDFPGGFGNFGTNIDRETITTITKRTEKFGINKALTGAFELDGYSSYDAMEDFQKGNKSVTDGQMITDFSEFECVINEELATLNNVKVDDTIKLKNSNTGKTYDFKVVGIYKESNDTDDTQSMYSKSVNTIIVGADLVKKLIEDDSSIVTNITPSFVLKGEKYIDKFSKELESKGLNESYTLSTNLDEIEGATKSIQNVGTFATTFLVITLIISSVVLLIINMINIRERKYEIGVFRTIGLSKIKLTTQFIIELAIVSLVGLMIGAGLGACASKSVGNYLLKSELEEIETSNNKQMSNFGSFDKNGGKPNINFNFNKGVQINQIDSINAVVNYVVLLELLGIGLFLTLISSLSSMISINRFSPLTILKERS